MPITAAEQKFPIATLVVMFFVNEAFELISCAAWDLVSDLSCEHAELMRIAERSAVRDDVRKRGPIVLPPFCYLSLDGVTFCTKDRCFASGLFVPHSESSVCNTLIIEVRLRGSLKWTHDPFFDGHLAGLAGSQGGLAQL